MSQVLVRLHWAAVAFKGDVPVLREPMHVVAAYTATDCAATKWICPPLPNLPSFFISHPYQDRWHARSSWRSWRALREMCWLGHDHLANLTGIPHASRKELHTDLTPSPPRSPGRPTPFPTFCEKPIHLVGLRRSLVRNHRGEITFSSFSPPAWRTRRARCQSPSGPRAPSAGTLSRWDAVRRRPGPLPGIPGCRTAPHNSRRT